MESAVSVAPAGGASRVAREASAVRRRLELPAAWLVAALAAYLAGLVMPAAAIAVGAVAGATAFVALGGELSRRVLGAMALGSAAAIPSDPAWALAGAAAALAAAWREPGPPGARDDDLELHLSWCRRRESPADLLVVSVPDHVTALMVAGRLRVTDSARVARRDGRDEVHAILDRHRLNRPAMAARVAGDVPGARCRWARFPEDGIALEQLLQVAMSDSEQTEKP